MSAPSSTGSSAWSLNRTPGETSHHAATRPRQSRPYSATHSQTSLTAPRNYVGPVDGSQITDALPHLTVHIGVSGRVPSAAAVGVLGKWLRRRRLWPDFRHGRAAGACL